LALKGKITFMVDTPDTPPDNATRAQARERLMQALDELDADMQRRGVTSEEIDAAVDEAMDNVRRRTP
jgi:hypothetical protein